MAKVSSRALREWDDQLGRAIAALNALRCEVAASLGEDAPAVEALAAAWRALDDAQAALASYRHEARR